MSNYKPEEKRHTTSRGLKVRSKSNVLIAEMLPDGRVSFEFSECREDYITSLKHSLAIADSQTKGPLEEFISALEHVDEEEGRRLVAHFEKIVKAERSQT